jgi:hypothetical protein
VEGCTERLMSLKLARLYRILRHTHDQLDKGDAREQAADGVKRGPAC